MQLSLASFQIQTLKFVYFFTYFIYSLISSFIGILFSFFYQLFNINILLFKILKYQKDQFYNMQLSNKAISIIRKLLMILVGCIIILSFVQISLIGKNITFSTRFTPPESQQNHLKNQTYITEAQVLIILLCVLYCFFLPLTLYIGLKQNKRVFFPYLIALIVINAILVFLNLYFLIGSSRYHEYMSQQYQNVVKNSGMCQTGNTTICTLGTCVRLRIFYQATNMAISFTVIDSIFSLIFTIGSIICNKRRKDSQKMQLIV